MLESFAEIWPHAIGVLTLGLTLTASAHAILHKRETRAAVGWVGVIWLAPVVGSILYIVFGVNRIRRRAQALRGPVPESVLAGDAIHAAPESRGGRLPPDEQFHPLARLIGGITAKPLLAGNVIVPYVNGDTAYPAMIEAINGAQHSVLLSTYIFNNDRAGEMFLQSLADAVERGVDVRVLIDDMGARYSWPSMPGKLRRVGIRVERFLPTWVPWRLSFLNLRNHRKILLVDGRVSFTGGMNISKSHLLASGPRRPVLDLHFRVEGPVVAHLHEVFAEDWQFATGENVHSNPDAVPVPSDGDVFARGIADGPDEDFEKLLWALHGALACAKTSIRILTPYFLPNTALIAALCTAARRGVEVDIIIPAAPNLRFVGWATMATLPELLKNGPRIWLTPPPFDHTKLMIVDDAWVLLGSANWDARSLELNFEFNLECYDRSLAAELDALVREKTKFARPLELGDIVGRRLPVRLRDGIARLFSPYF